MFSVVSGGGEAVPPTPVSAFSLINQKTGLFGPKKVAAWIDKHHESTVKEALTELSEKINLKAIGILDEQEALLADLSPTSQDIIRTLYFSERVSVGFSALTSGAVHTLSGKVLNGEYVDSGSVTPTFEHYSDITPTNSFARILARVQSLTEMGKSVIVVSDIDDCLLKPTIDIGSEQWLQSLKAKYPEKIKKILKVKNKIESQMSDMCLMEEQIPAILHEVKKTAACTVLALTARSGGNRALTEHVLKANHLVDEETPLIDALLMDGQTNKYAQFQKWQAETGSYPDAVIFIDDKTENVENMQRGISENGMEAHCFHYTPSTPSPTHLTPISRAQKQLGYFLEADRLISNEEADALKPYSDKKIERLLETKVPVR